MCSPVFVCVCVCSVSLCAVAAAAHRFVAFALLYVFASLVLSCVIAVTRAH